MDALRELKKIMQETAKPQITIIKAFKLIYASNLSHQTRKELFICFADEFATTKRVSGVRSQLSVSQQDIILTSAALDAFIDVLGERVMNNLIALKVSNAPFEKACEVMFNLIENAPSIETKLGAFMAIHMTPYFPYSLPHLEIDDKESEERKKDAEFSRSVAHHLIDKMDGGGTLYFSLLSLLKLYDGKLEQQLDIIDMIFQTTVHKTRAELISTLMHKLQSNHAAMKVLQEMIFTPPQPLLQDLPEDDIPMPTMQSKRDLPN